MAKKRNLFSGTLSAKERKSIEKQLATSRARDIAAMQKANAARNAARDKVKNQMSITEDYKSIGFSDAKKGDEAFEKYSMIMDALSEKERNRLRGTMKDIRINGEFATSDDILEAADYITSGKLGDRKFFRLSHLVDAMEEIRVSAKDEIDETVDPFDNTENPF